MRGSASPQLGADKSAAGAYAASHLIPTSSSQPQPSELRAALAQPSKLKQEKKIQRGGVGGGSNASQHSPIDARLPHPSAYDARAAEHMMGAFPPPQLQDLPRSRANSKSEHRPTSTPNAHDLQGAMLALSPALHSEVQAAAAAGMMQYHRGHLAGLQYLQMQAARMPVPDPKWLPHALDMSMPDVQQMLSAGMIPPQLMAAQLPQVDARGSAHPAAAHGNAPPPSSRAGPPHHSPQITTPLTPQLPMPPVAALPSQQAIVEQNRELAHMFDALQVTTAGFEHHYNTTML